MSNTAAPVRRTLRPAITAARSGGAPRIRPEVVEPAIAVVEPARSAAGTAVVEPVRTAVVPVAKSIRANVRSGSAPTADRPSHRRAAQAGGGVPARASKRPATSTERSRRLSSSEPVVAGSAVTVADGAVAVEAVSARGARPRTADRTDAVRRAALRAVPSTPVSDPAPAPGGAAASAATVAGGAAAALLSLFVLVLAAPRLGSLLRLLESRAPLAPALALPERPG